MRLKAILFAVVLGLLGCSTAPKVPPAPSFSMPAGSKVGVLVSVRSDVVHEHIGTTIFNNFSLHRNLGFQPEARAKEYLDSALKAAGLVVVDLGSVGLAPTEINALAISNGQAWQENPVQSGQLDRLRGELGLRAVVVLQDTGVTLGPECSGGPCTDRSISGSGLYTRGVFNLTNYVAVAGVQTKVFTLSPVSELSAVDPLRTTLSKRLKMVRYNAEPANLRAMTDDEFRPIEQWIDEYLRTMSDAVATSLVSGS